MDELTIKRLAVIKQLYLHGVDQSYDVEPMNGFSILSFHDSVEMFMKLCAEVTGVKIDRNANFGDYFSKLPKLQCNATMSNLNSKRVNLKHYGTIPSNMDIDISRANVTDFFVQNTPLFFNVSFDEISLISLISYKGVQKYLVEAQNAVLKDDYKGSIENSQIAFKELLIAHKEENSMMFKSPFKMTQDFTFLNSFSLGIRSGDNRKYGEFVDRVGKTFEKMENTVSIIGFGIDYKRYCKFKLLSPYINVWNKDGKRVYEAYDVNDNRICDKKNALFCFNFVIDSALKLQKFNLDIYGTIKK